MWSLQLYHITESMFSVSLSPLLHLIKHVKIRLYYYVIVSSQTPAKHLIHNVCSFVFLHQFLSLWVSLFPSLSLSCHHIPLTHALSCSQVCMSVGWCCGSSAARRKKHQPQTQEKAEGKLFKLTLLSVKCVMMLYLPWCCDHISVKSFIF